MTLDAVREQPTRRQLALLLALSIVGFLGSTSGIALSPFLLAMASDLSTDLGAMSMLFTFSNIAWALTSLGAGPLSDRLGRKPIMLVGLGLMSISSLASALAQDYPTLVAARFVNGVGGGTQMPTVYASAAELLPGSQRGKALGWVMTGQSLSLVLGGPFAALIGAFAGWRWALGSLGLLGLVWLVLLAVLLPESPRVEARHATSEVGLGRLLTSRRTLALFAASACERVCYSSAVIFFATYLIASYGVPLHWLAGALVVVAIGNVVGSQVGGTLSDRLGNRYTLVAGAMLANAVLALPLLLLAPGIVVSVLICLVYNLANGLARPPLLWLISQISREARGTLMGVQVTVAGIGWLTASALGGWLIVTYGFGAIGLLAAACGLGSAAFAALAGLLARSAPRPRETSLGSVQPRPH